MPDFNRKTFEMVYRDKPIALLQYLLNLAMERGGRFSLSIVADPPRNSGGLYRPAFVFRTLPYRTNPKYLKYVLSAAIQLRNHLNVFSGTEVLRIPFFFVDHIASKLDCIRVLESLTCRS